MAVIITNTNWLQIDGARLQKGKWDLSLTVSGVRLSDAGERIDIPYIGTTIDGATVTGADELFAFFEAQGFRSSGTGSGTGGVQSVTGNIVSGTAENPVVNMPADISNHPARTDNPHNVNKGQVGLENVDNTSDLNKPISAATLSALADKQSLSEKGQAGGYPSLDNSGKIPLEFLNVSGLTFKGAWDASTNTPTLLDGTGSVGDFYKVSVGGTYNFGNGEHTFVEGDWVMFAAGVWQRIGVHETVQSVNGKIGAVVINKTDIGLPNVDDTSDANKPISTATQAALNGKQATLVSGTNIKTLNGQSLLGDGDLQINSGADAVINTSFANNVRTNEYANRFEYISKINIGSTVSASAYNTVATNTYFPVGATIDGANEHYISIRNNERTVGINVFDNVTTGRISIGYHNSWTASINVAGTVFIKLVYYK